MAWKATVKSNTQIHALECCKGTVFKKSACSSHILLQHLVVINLLERDSKFTVLYRFICTL